MGKVAFVVGTDGNFNYRVIYADSEAAAIEEWRDGAQEAGTPTVERKPEWDGKNVETGGSKWFRSGYGRLLRGLWL